MGADTPDRVDGGSDSTDWSRRCELIFEASPTPMVVLSTDRVVERVNPALVALLGYGVEDFAGRRPEDFVHPDDLPDLSRDGGPLRLRTASGSYRVFQVGVEVVDEPDGFVLATLTDITDQRRAEADRTALIGALRAANDALDRFARSTAHDLRNPLGAVRGFAQILQQSDDPGHLQEVLPRILAASQRALDMVDGLLDAARSPGAEHHPVDLDESLQWALDLLETQVAEAAADIDAQPLPTIQGIEASWRQIFLNLISNALKYRDLSRTARVVVTAVDGTRYLEIRVADNGLGIPVDRRLSVFQPGERITERDAAIEGSGIGLASTRAAVEQHGGRIRVEDTPGGGATFVLRLPATIRV